MSQLDINLAWNSSPVRDLGVVYKNLWWAVECCLVNWFEWTTLTLYVSVQPHEESQSCRRNSQPACRTWKTRFSFERNENENLLLEKCQISYFLSGFGIIRFRVRFLLLLFLQRKFVFTVWDTEKTYRTRCKHKNKQTHYKRRPCTSKSPG